MRVIESENNTLKLKYKQLKNDGIYKIANKLQQKTD